MRLKLLEKFSANGKKIILQNETKISKLGRFIITENVYNSSGVHGCVRKDRDINACKNICMEAIIESCALHN